MSSVKSTNRFALFFFVFFLLSTRILYIFPSLIELPYTTLSIVLSLFSFGTTILVYFMVTKHDIKSTLKLYPLSLRNVFFCIIFVPAIQPIMSFLAVIFSIFFPNLVEESFSLADGSSLFALLFSMAILPAILEEVTLRGIFLSGYKDLGDKKAIWYTALLFGMLHMNPQQVPYAIFAGLIFCFLVQRMGSIWAGIIPHFLINGSSVVISYFMPIEESANTSVLDMFTPSEILLYTGLPALCSIPFLYFLVYLVCRFNPKDENLTTEETEFSPPVIAPQDVKSEYNPDIIRIEENPYTKAEQELFNTTKHKFFTWEIWAVVVIFIVFGVVPFIEYFMDSLQSLY